MFSILAAAVCVEAALVNRDSVDGSPGADVRICRIVLINHAPDEF